MKKYLFLVVSLLMICLPFMLQAKTILLLSDEPLKEVEKFGKATAKKYQMKYLARGVGSIVESAHTSWDLAFSSRSLKTIEQARQLAESVTKEFVDLIYRKPIFDEALKAMNKKKYFKVVRELAPERIGFRITFWDQNMDRPLAPYIAQIQVLDNRIEYYQANPKDQSLLPPTVETFEEAFKDKSLKFN